MKEFFEALGWVLLMVALFALFIWGTPPQYSAECEWWRNQLEKSSS